MWARASWSPTRRMRADRRAHAGELAVLEHRLGEQRVGGDQRGLQRELGVVRRGVGRVGLDDALDRDRRGDVAAGVAAHAVGDDEEVRARRSRSPGCWSGSFRRARRPRSCAVVAIHLPPQLEARRADLDRSVQRHRGRHRHARAVEERAVGRVEVLDHPLVVPEHEPGVVGRGVVVADDEAAIRSSGRW